VGSARPSGGEGWLLMALCECGLSKRRGAEACDRCIMLDGNGSGESRIISALRVLGGSATLETLVDHLGTTERNVSRYLAPLHASGKVRRHIDESATGPQVKALHSLAEQVVPSRPDVKPWGQLVLHSAPAITLAWVRSCRHLQRDAVFTAGERLIAFHCHTCPAIHPVALLALEVLSFAVRAVIHTWYVEEQLALDFGAGEKLPRHRRRPGWSVKDGRAKPPRPMGKVIVGGFGW
jgi:hypothetical protein